MRGNPLGGARLSAAAALLLIAACAPLPVPGRTGLHQMSFTTRTLQIKNGLRVIVEEDHSSPVVGVVALVGVGSSSDPTGKEGLAHFVEHLAFRCKPDGKSKLSNLFARVGVADFNAATSLDTTIYSEFGPAESLASLLALEGARLVDPLAHVDKVTFDVEREVVRNELRLRNETGYYSQLLSWAQSAAFPPGHPYSRPLIGTHESLSSIGLEDARQFVTMYYRPERIILAVVGDVSVAGISEVLARSLPAQLWEASTAVAVQRAPAELAPPPEASKGELDRFTASVAIPQLLIAWGLPRIREDDDLVVDSMVKLLNFGLRRVDDEDVSSVRIGVITGSDGALLLCEVLLKHGTHPEKSAQRVLNQMQILNRRGPLTTLGLDQLRFGAHAYLVYELEDIQSRALFLARAAAFSKADQAYTRAVKALEAISTHELVRFTNEYLTPSRARIAFVLPHAIDALDVDLDGRPRLEASDDGVTVLYPSEAIRSIMHPVATKQFHTLHLKNGLEVIIAPRAAWPLVTIELGVRGGRATAKPRGVAELSRLARPKRFGEHGLPGQYGIQIREAITEDAVLTQVNAGSGNLAVALAILSDGIQDLEVTESALSNFRKRDLPLIETLEQTPRRRAERALSEALLPSPLFAAPATPRDLAHLDAEEIEGWLKQAYGPSNAVLSIVGDVDPIAASKAVQRWFGDWDTRRGGESKGQVKPASLKSPAERKSVLVTHRPAATQVEIQLGCAFEPDGPSGALSYQILADLIAQVLSDSARERLGATYGFAVSPKALEEMSFRFLVSGAVDNSNFNQVIALIRENWPKVPRQRLDASSIDRVRWNIARRYNLRFTTTPALADALVRTRLRGWSPEVLEGFPDLLLGITPDDVRKAATACEKTAVLSLIGDERVINQGLKATQSGL